LVHFQHDLRGKVRHTSWRAGDTEIHPVTRTGQRATAVMQGAGVLGLRGVNPMSRYGSAGALGIADDSQLTIRCTRDLGKTRRPIVPRAQRPSQSTLSCQ
jgi:hypothetical protein